MLKYLIRSAVEKRPVEIIYQSKDGNISKRVIFIKKVSDTSIFAYCYSKQQYRTFLVTQILAFGPVKNQTKKLV